MKTLTLKAEEMPWMDRFCRSGLFGTLKNLHTGSITVFEGEDSFLFGDGGSDFSVNLTINDSEAYRSIALKKICTIKLFLSAYSIITVTSVQ